MTTTKERDWIILCDEIDDGTYDEGLNEIVKTINMRREVVIRRKARRLAVNLEAMDKVILTNGIKPKYLDGITGHIVKLQGDSAIVMVDELPSAHAGRPSKSKQSRKYVIPLVHIEKLDEDTGSLKDLDDDDFIEDDDDDDTGDDE